MTHIQPTSITKTLEIISLDLLILHSSLLVKTLHPFL